MDERRHAVLGCGPALVAEALRGADHGERAAAQGRQGLRLLEHRGTMEISSRPLRNARGVEPMASTTAASSAGSVGAGGVTGRRPRRASVGRIARPRRISGVLGGVVGDGGELVGAGAVQQHHAGDLLGVRRGVGHGVGAADGVPDQHVRSCSPAAASSGVQVPSGGHAVLGARDVVAPALPGAVVGADPGGGADRVGDPGPGGGELAHAVEEHDRGSAGALAVEVQPVVAHLVGLPGGRVGALDATGGDVLRGGADGRGSQDHQDRRQQPAATAGQGAAHPDEHPAAEGQHRRRPHPGERGEGGVLRGEDQEAGTGGRIATAGTVVHRWGWVVIRRRGRASSPSRARRPGARIR